MIEGKLTTINPDDYLTEKGRNDIDLGKNPDGTHTILPGYVDIDGVQVHPERVEAYLEERGQARE